MTTNLPFSITLKHILSSLASLVVITLFFITRTGFSPSSLIQPPNHTLRISNSSTRTELRSPESRSCGKIPPSLADALVHYAASNVTPQQTFSEISVTKKVLEKKSPCNFLVFGLGHDSLMWATLNYGGRTIFLEEDESWIHQIAEKFPSLESYHVRYKTKLIWRLISAGNSLWAKWIHSNLIKEDTLWSVRASSNAGSWMWRKILKYRTIAQSFLHMEINSGTSTSFWYDRWNQLGQLHGRLGSRGFIDLGISSHATVADAMDSLRRRRHRNTILNHIEEAIATVRMRRNDAADQPLWKFNDESFKPKFSSRHTWEQIRESHPQCDWYRGVWFPFSTPKYAFITWLAFHDRLATGDKLHTWSTSSQSGCVFCDEGVETKSHLFFSCPYSSQVWSALARGLLQTHYTTSWTSIVPLLLDTTQPKLHTFTLRYVFQISLHSLWRERNGRRHGKSPTPVPVLIRYIDKHVRNRFSTLREAGKFEEGLRFWFYTRTL